MPTCWKARLLYGCALWSTGIVHHNLVLDVSNTPEGMLIYHGLAAATDFLLLVCAAHLLSGHLSRDMQNLSYVSMVVNFAGWLLYLAYAPPDSYDIAIRLVTYVQFARLITVGPYGIDRVGECLFRGHDFGGSKLHHEKAQP